MSLNNIVTTDGETRLWLPLHTEAFHETGQTKDASDTRTVSNERHGGDDDG